MAATSKRLKTEKSLGSERHESAYGSADAVIRRATSFPVRGGDFVRIERQSWYKSLLPKRSMKGR